MIRGDGRPRVLVTDSGRGSALAVIRSLGRRGWHVVAADADPLSPGFHSRYAAGRVRYPSPLRHPDAAAARLLRAAREHAIDLIVPVTDEVILPLVDATGRSDPDGSQPSAEPGSPMPRLAVAPRPALERAWDKWATLQAARDLGIGVPATELAGSADEAVAAAEMLGWPVVLKPRRSRLYCPGQPIERFEVRYANDRDGVSRVAAAICPRTEILVQEWCDGEGQGVELLMNDGEPLAAFQHRRLREVPATGGASAYRESVALDPDLYDAATRLLRLLGWHGLAMVEFRVGTAGAKLMEVNGRIWGSLPLAVACGVDFPAAMADLYLDGAPLTASDGEPRDRVLSVQAGARPASYALGVRAHNLRLELSWIARMLVRPPVAPDANRGGRVAAAHRPFRRRDALVALSSLFRSGDRFDLGSRDDPLPGVVELVGLASQAGRSIAGRLAASGRVATGRMRPR